MYYRQLIVIILLKYKTINLYRYNILLNKELDHKDIFM